MKASQSFGPDYDCQKNWPTDIFMQCGKEGIVISSKKEKPSYRTSFFEAFPNDPSTFIRGEGSSIEDAEDAAFQKYEKIMACNEHDYKRRLDSEHGTCIKCGLFTSNCFPPVHSCSVCQKTEVNYNFNKNNYCCEHYMQAVQTIVQNYSLTTPEYENSFSETSLNKYNVEHLAFLNLACKYNLLDKSQEEYKIHNYIDKQQSKFNEFIYSKSVSIYNKFLKENNPLSFFQFSKFTGKIFINEKLHESMFLDFSQLQFENYDDIFKDFFISYIKIKDD